MTRRKQELLDKLILLMIGVFLVAMGTADILSKAKQPNTQSAAVISYPGQK